MAKVIGIRPTVNSSVPSVDHVVDEALAALNQQISEATANGDPMRGLLVSQALLLQAQKAVADQTAATIAGTRAPIGDEQWRVIRGDLRRVATTVLSGQLPLVAAQARTRSFAILSTLLAAMLVLGIVAGRFAWPGDPPGARCLDQANGSRWCETRPARG
jgi:hypothetical protein